LKEYSQVYFCQDINNEPGIIKFIDDYGETANHHVNLKIEETKRTLNKAFEGISSTRQKVKALNLSTSFLFSVFDLFRVNENKMSEILAFLLNPQGKHGQGDIYFRIFCQYFELPEIDISRSFYIRCEESTNINRRIDLLIKAGDYFIIIENKFRGAEDQKHQLEHYYEFIRRKAGSEKYVYLFYIKDGTEPSEYSLPKNGDAWKELSTSSNLKYISFKQHSKNRSNVIEFLELCKNKTISEKMQFFIDDLIHHISRENKMKKYGEAMFNWLSESPERTENAYEIYSRWDAYKKHVIQVFLNEFYIELNKALSFKFNTFKAEKYNDFFKERYSGYRVYIMDDYHVYIQSDNIGFDNIHYGLAPLHNDNKDASKRNIDLTLREKILNNYSVKDGFVTDASIVKYKSKISDLSDISNFTKLLPANKEETMSIWIDEVISLIDFILNPEYLGEICKP
jgi:hypothetical protein